MRLELHEELVDVDAVLSCSERREEGAITLSWERLRWDLVSVVLCLEEVIGEIVQSRESFGHG